VHAALYIAIFFAPPYASILGAFSSKITDRFKWGLQYFSAVNVSSAKESAN
jgi:hypothetical protein